MNRNFLIMSAIALTFIGAGCATPTRQVTDEADMTTTESVNAMEEASETAKVAPANIEPQTAADEAAANAVAPTSEDAMPIAKSEPVPAPAYERPTEFPGILPKTETSGKIARLITTKGEIVFDILDEEGPMSASNFVALARTGFYDGLTFHRVVPGFVIQGGDPSGDGTGGPGYTFGEDKVTLDYDAGIVAMAKRPQPGTSGSQFFIMLEDYPLPKEYSIFGRVRTGLDVVRSIKIGDIMTKVTIEPAP